jgi:1-deoxy-D-xylulose-5-phosphate reductoisomerase
MTSGRDITILGSTGSVGANTVALIADAQEREPGRYRVRALTAQNNANLLAQQAIQLGAKHAAIGDASKLSELRSRLSGTGISTAAGEGAVVEAATMPADWVMAAIVGAVGLAPALEAVRRGATIALANKECLVTAGALFVALAAKHGARIIPVDSEHSAVFQVLDQRDPDSVSQVTITASGGPFRTWSLEQMASATPAEACAHPIWSMGAKISVDSATLMNKGLELIEAHHLFGLPPTKLNVVVHPQSIVHALVSYIDGSTLAQIAAPDMRTPIAVALAYPGRMAWGARPIRLADIGKLEFEEPDLDRFPCLGLAIDALKAGGAVPTILNAANEVAVEAFLAKRLAFPDIAKLVEDVIETMSAEFGGRPPDLASVLALDQEARARATEFVRVNGLKHNSAKLA